MSLGPGSMRALVASLSGSHPIRETITRLAARFSARTPHVLWVLVIIHRDARQIAIACWYAGRTTPRTVALVASQQQVVDSDSETLCALCAAASDSDIATHSRWLEILGRETVSRNFFRAMQASVTQLAASLVPGVATQPATELAVLYLSRLVFLSFIETKGWLNGDHAFLANQFADCMVAGGRYHTRVLAPLFFGTLNTRPANRAQRSRAFGRVPFLNGGLFARSAVERSHAGCVFSDEALGDVFGQLLTRYRFTAREDSSVWSEAAVDPEMLGKTFESLMAAPDRKTTGAFYTPQALVEQLTTSALASAISAVGVPAESIIGALAGELPSTDHRRRILAASERLRVLDPACGSGAFLVHLLERLAALRVHLGESRPIHAVRRDILTRSIFGVDVNPTAVWLCELRLWLSMAIENPERDPMKVTPLPNLDRNIRVGDSLAGGSFHGLDNLPRPARITSLRARYSRTVGRKKKIVGRMLDQLERDCAIGVLSAAIVKLTLERRELLGAVRSPDLFGERRHALPSVRLQLAQLRESGRSAQSARRTLLRGGALPFAFDTQFADVGAAGGFDIIIGNPPWVRLHHVDQHAKDLFAREFVVFRESAWQAGHGRWSRIRRAGGSVGAFRREIHRAGTRGRNGSASRSGQALEIALRRRSPEPSPPADRDRRASRYDGIPTALRRRRLSIGNRRAAEVATRATGTSRRSCACWSHNVSRSNMSRSVFTPGDCSGASPGISDALAVRRGAPPLRRDAGKSLADHAARSSRSLRSRSPGRSPIGRIPSGPPAARREDRMQRSVRRETG